MDMGDLNSSSWVCTKVTHSCVYSLMTSFYFQDPAGIFELIEVVGNGTYGQVYKVRTCIFITQIFIAL
jgi:hypothetical protein